MIYLDYPSISPIIFSIGPFEIRWYSMAYIIGFLFAWQYIKFLSNKKELFGFETNLDSQSVDDLIFYSIIGLIVGARLAYVIFYNGTYYLNNPIHALYVWEGGLSFHGGLVGIIIAIFYIKLKYKIKFYIISDLICSSAPVGIFFGRIANFINGELYGRPSSSYFGMIFPNTDGKIRHPSQLYEAFFEGILIFLILNFLIFGFKKLSNPGLISSIFLILYGTFRFLIEFTREPDAQLGFIFNFLTMGMILSVPMIIAGFVILFISKKNNVD
jgi:phosphatidylglycerol:prolipoprotein diacylglycerol transferase